MPLPPERPKPGEPGDPDSEALPIAVINPFAIASADVIAVTDPPTVLRGLGR